MKELMESFFLRFIKVAWENILGNLIIEYSSKEKTQRIDCLWDEKEKCKIDESYFRFPFQFFLREEYLSIKDRRGYPSSLMRCS